MGDILKVVKKQFGAVPKRRGLLLAKLLEDHPETGEAITKAARRKAASLDDVCAAGLNALCRTKPKTVAIDYSPDFWASIGDDIPRMITVAGYNCLILSLNPSYDENGDVHVYPVDREILARMDSIDAHIGADFPRWMSLEKGVFADVKSICIDRSARAFFSASPEWCLPALSSKYVITPMKSSDFAAYAGKTIDIPSSIKLPCDLIGPRRETYVLPSLPSKYERIRMEEEGLNSSEIDRILVCPSISDLPEYFTRKYGMAIVSELINKYPNYVVAFRPRSVDRNNPEVQEITKAFSGYKNFVFDTKDDYTEQYARGLLLITDRSSTGQTFSLATGRPSIYFPQPPGHTTITIPEMINNGCFKVESLDSLFKKVEEFVRRPNACKENIQRVYQSVYAGNESFLKKFMENIDAILNDRVGKTWTRIRLRPENIAGSSAEDYEASIVSLANMHNHIFVLGVYGIVEKYIAMMRKKRMPIPGYVMDKLFSCHTHCLVNIHAGGHVELSRISQVISHNIRYGAADESTLRHLKQYAEALLNRGHKSAIDFFLRSLVGPPATTSGEATKSYRVVASGEVIANYLSLKIELMALNNVKRIALFGAGKHTRWMRKAVHLPWGLAIVAVLDDNPADVAGFLPLEVCPPEKFNPQDCDAVVLSTDAHHVQFTARCQELWGNAVKVVDLYDGLPQGPYNKELNATSDFFWKKTCQEETITVQLKILRLTRKVHRVVFFGAGQHTRRLNLKRIIKRSGVRIVAVLDDAAQSETAIDGIRIVEPNQIKTTEFDAVLLSTDSISDCLMKRCQELFPNNLPIIDPYSGNL